ncbi:hypothetical protein [Brevibacillus laterosporus]|uniref:hypothetical protein n=1 Tax=Brevibacillus laterosporus TaxID=1465 RepID=UPI003CE77C9C
MKSSMYWESSIERTEIENHYYPKDQMTRAEFVSTLVRAVGYAPSNMKTGFTDIENNSAVKDIQAAAEHHLLNEESGDRFEPDRVLSIFAPKNYCFIKKPAI